MALKDAQGQLSSRSQVYLQFTCDETLFSNPDFYWGDIAFPVTNAYGGLPVQPVVLSWGNLVKYLAEGQINQNQTTIRLSLEAKATDYGATTEYTVAYVLQNMDIRDQAVTVYQWNAGASTQEVIWKGYWGGIVGYSFSDGVGTVDIGLSSLERSAENTIGEVVTRSIGTYTDAPDSSFGLMNIKGYGKLSATVDTALEHATNLLPPILLGYSQRAGGTVVTNESLAYTKISSRYRACQNDGVSAANLTAVGAISSGTIGKWFVYEPSIGAYGHVESTEITASGNTSTDTNIELSNSPVVYFAIRPTKKHSSTSAGITDISQAVNDDPADYLTLTEANPVAAYECPSISIPSGSEVQDIRVAVDIYSAASNGNGVAVGIWDPYTGGGAFWGNANHYQNLDVVDIVNGYRNHHITSGAGGAGAWGVWASESANATGTLPEFVGGQFMGIDAASSNQRKPLVIRVQWNSNAASGATYRVYGVCLLVKVIYPKVKIGNALAQRYDFRKKERVDLPNTIGNPIFGVPQSAPGTQIIWTGEYQEDDGGGTITGTAAAVIQKAPDIARHLIQIIGAKTVNSTSGTLGNFVDARTETVAGELSINPIFGPSEIVSRENALEQIMQRWPIRLYPEDGTWQCVLNEMNPHSSRVYRSTSDPVEIEPWDIIDGSMNIQEIDVRSFVNKVTVSGGHSYGRNEPLASFTYNNPLSQLYWGESQEQTIDEPWCPVPDLVTGASESIKYLARFYGRVNARPRLTVKVGLTQKFYDLRPGHVLQFSRNMEAAGIHCPAYRTGRLDYAYPSSATSTNQADDATPAFISSGGVDREAYFGMSQQTDSITFTIFSAGTYTDSANPWQYWNGSAWTDLTGVTASDGGTTPNVFERTGAITVSFTRPTITSWPKAEIELNSVLRGPCYWLRHKAVNVTVAATGNALTVTPARWWGRLFEVVETNRTVGSGEYPSMEAVIREVM